MSKVPAFLLAALQFQEPKLEALCKATDAEWEAVLSNWFTARLALPLGQDCGDYLPEWVRSRMDGYLSDTALRFERIKAAYKIAAKALSNVRADHVVIKGFSLCPGFAEHPWLRPQGDIDVYCPPESIFRARNALIGLGYCPDRQHEHAPKDHLNILVPKHSWKPRENLFDPDMPICFELHYCWWNEAIMRFHPDGLEQFWPRRIVQQLDNVSFPGLDQVDSVAYVALRVLRALLREMPDAEQVYALARFLHTRAEDREFWRRWRELHDGSLRRLEAISFRLASEQFACRVPEEVQEEVDRLPPIVKDWFRKFSRSPFDASFGQARNGIWLHLSLVDSFYGKSRVIFTGLLSVPMTPPEATLASAKSFQRAQSTLLATLSKLPRSCSQAIKLARWFLRRNVVRLPKLPLLFVFLWHGMRFQQSRIGFSRQFWKFLAASFCFDLGMTIFFFLYNLLLLERGFQTDFLGAMASAMNLGTIVCTIPAGILIQRLGLRKSLLICFASVPFVCAGQSLFASKSLLLALAFLGGFVSTIWAVAISPAITQLTSEKTRPLGFSIVFSTGIGMGVLANLIASRMPGWFTHLSPFLSVVQAEQLALLVGSAIVALGLLPLSGMSFPAIPVKDKTAYSRNPFLWRFLPALALWSLVTGSLSPLANVYLAQHLQMTIHRIGTVFSVSSLFQVLAVLFAPVLFRRLGLVSGIASAQLATAVTLACLAATSAQTPATFIYLGYTALLWMSEPGLFSLLMSRVTPAQQAGASALNFLVISLAQAVAVAAAGASFARFGYPIVLYAMAAVALTASICFRFMLGSVSFEFQKDTSSHHPISESEGSLL